jgi:serine/threonine-protein kinase RIO1
LSFDRIELKEMMSQSNGKEINYIQRLVDLAVASPQNLTINQEMTLLEFVETEKAIIRYNNSKNKK